MTESCRDRRGDLAAFAINRLDANETLALQAHVDGCAGCRAELDELRGVASALPATDGARLGVPPEPPTALGDKVIGTLAWARAGERKRRRRHLTVVVATAVISVAAAFGLFALGSDIHNTDHSGRQVAFTTEPQGVLASATLHKREYGTEVTLRVKGMDDAKDWYWLWLTGADGKRIGAGTFQVSDGEAEVQMNAAIPLDATRRVWVTDSENRVVLDTGQAPELAPPTSA
jgi:hypothetical protein